MVTGAGFRLGRGPGRSLESDPGVSFHTVVASSRRLARWPKASHVALKGPESRSRESPAAIPEVRIPPCPCVMLADRESRRLQPIRNATLQNASPAPVSWNRSSLHDETWSWPSDTEPSVPQPAEPATISSSDGHGVLPFGHRSSSRRTAADFQGVGVAASLSTPGSGGRNWDRTVLRFGRSPPPFIKEPTIDHPTIIGNLHEVGRPRSGGSQPDSEL